MGRGFLLGGQRSTSFSHERGDAFQIFCCVLLRPYSSLGSMQKCCQLWPLKCFEVLDWRHVLQRPLSVQSSSEWHERAP